MKNLRGKTKIYRYKQRINKKLSDYKFYIIEPQDYNISKHFSNLQYRSYKTSFNTKRNLNYQLKKYFFRISKLVSKYNLDFYENNVIPVKNKKLQKYPNYP